MESDNVERDDYIPGMDMGETKSAILLIRTSRKKTDGVELLERCVVLAKGNWQEVPGTFALRGGEMVKRHDILPDGCVIGISCGDPLDSGSGVILSPPNPPDWDEVPITEYTEQKLGMPTRLGSDAGARTLTEWRYGAGQGYRHMIFLIFGTGLGAGLILNDRLYQEAYGVAGKAGHTRLDQDRLVRYRKARGSEGFCSGGGTAQLMRRMTAGTLKEEKNVSYSGKKGLDFIAARDVAEAAECGMEDTLQIYGCLGKYFGRSPAVLIDILNLKQVVMGSILARSGRLMREKMEKKPGKEALSESPTTCTIVSTTLGDRIGDYGTVMAALG